MAKAHNDMDEEQSSNPLFESGGPLSDPLERLAIFSALDSF